MDSGCECYQVGGRWIDFDPDCPAHGYDAQRRDEEEELRNALQREADQNLREQISTMQAEIRTLSTEIKELRNALNSK